MTVNLNRSSIPLIIALLLIISGIVFLLENLTSIKAWQMVLPYWPVLILIIGIFSIVRGIYNNKHQISTSPWLWFTEVVFALVIIGFGLGTDFLVNAKWDLSMFEPPLVSAKTSKSGVIKFKGEKINVENDLGTIKVTTWDKPEVKYSLKVTLRGSTLKSAKKRLTKHKSYFAVNKNDEVLKIRIKEPYILNNGSSVNIVLKVPKKTSLDFDALGDISVKGVDNKVNVTSDIGMIDVRKINGSVNAQSDTGDVFAKNIDGDIRINTDTGSVDVIKIKNDIYIESDTGDVKILNPEGLLRVDTDTGDIKINSNSSLLDDWRFQTDTGDVTIKLPVKAGFWLDATTEAGSISDKFKSFDIKGAMSDEGEETSKKTVNGGGKQLYFRSDTGSLIFD